MSDEFTNDLSNEERETHLNMTGDDHGTWHVFTDDPYWVRRLERAGAELVAEVGKGRKYRLPGNQVTIRRPPKPRKAMSEKQKAALVERLQAGRAAAEES